MVSDDYRGQRISCIPTASICASRPSRQREHESAVVDRYFEPQFTSDMSTANMKRNP
jgi:hypothetical protein